MVTVKVHYVLRGKMGVRQYQVADTSVESLRAAVDLFEGQFGDVWAIYNLDGTRLFKSVAEPHELMAR